MRQDDLAHVVPFSNQFVNTGGERRLFLFVGRAGIDDDEFARAHEVSVRVRRGRLGRRADGEADEAGQEFDPAHGFAARLWHAQETLNEIISQAISERLDGRSEEHTSELQSQSNLVCRLLLEKKKSST